MSACDVLRFKSGQPGVPANAALLRVEHRQIANNKFEDTAARSIGRIVSPRTLASRSERDSKVALPLRLDYEELRYCAEA
jgi:hypothetical protein